MAQFEIHIDNFKGDKHLSPEVNTMSDAAEIIDIVRELLKNVNAEVRSNVYYAIGEGSIRHIFTGTTQTIAVLGTVLSLVTSKGNLDDLDNGAAKTIERLQDFSKKKGYLVELKSSIGTANTLVISPDTNYHVTKPVLADAEMFFYGTLNDAGGAGESNIHLSTKEYGSLTIKTDRKFLSEKKENILYKTYGARVKCKQDVRTGEFDKDSLQLIDLYGYNPVFNQEKFDAVCRNARAAYEGIDIEDYLKELRLSRA